MYNQRLRPFETSTEWLIAGALEGHLISVEQGFQEGDNFGLPFLLCGGFNREQCILMLSAVERDVTYELPAFLELKQIENCLPEENYLHLVSQLDVVLSALSGLTNVQAEGHSGMSDVMRISYTDQNGQNRKVYIQGRFNAPRVVTDRDALVVPRFERDRSPYRYPLSDLMNGLPIPFVRQLLEEDVLAHLDVRHLNAGKFRSNEVEAEKRKLKVDVLRVACAQLENLNITASSGALEFRLGQVRQSTFIRYDHIGELISVGFEIEVDYGQRGIVFRPFICVQVPNHRPEGAPKKYYGKPFLFFDTQQGYLTISQVIKCLQPARA